MVDSMSSGQAQIDQIAILNNLVQSLLQLMGPSAPSVIPGALYTGKQLERNLTVGDKTLTWWKDNGLRSYKPATRGDMFLGAEVFEFVTTHGDLEPPKNYAEQLKRRKEQAARSKKARGNGKKEDDGQEEGAPRKR